MLLKTTNVNLKVALQEKTADHLKSNILKAQNEDFYGGSTELCQLMVETNRYTCNSVLEMKFQGTLKALEGWTPVLHSTYDLEQNDKDCGTGL